MFGSENRVTPEEPLCMSGRGPIVSSCADVTSLSLLVRARGRDQEAWRRLVMLYSPLICYWCGHAGVGQDDTEDLLQEVLLSVASHFDSFHREAGTGSFRGWLRTITRHKVTDYFRRRQAQPPTIRGDAGGWARLAEMPQEVSAEEEAAEERALCLQALALLEPEFAPQTWKAFWQVCMVGRDPARVAEELSMSRNMVYLAKSRVLRRLREECADLLV
jgi:RNA polymerase sigma-70 factor (ECF subfamily)